MPPKINCPHQTKKGHPEGQPYNFEQNYIVLCCYQIVIPRLAQQGDGEPPVNYTAMRLLSGGLPSPPFGCRVMT